MGRTLSAGLGRLKPLPIRNLVLDGSQLRRVGALALSGLALAASVLCAAGTAAASGRLPARRYGPSGSFWAQNPQLPRHPITAWQIWNEPNLPVYWRPRPSAAAYVQMLRLASQRIKAVDPSAEIVTAGLPN